MTFNISWFSHRRFLSKNKLMCVIHLLDLHLKRDDWFVTFAEWRPVTISDFRNAKVNVKVTLATISWWSQQTEWSCGSRVYWLEQECVLFMCTHHTVSRLRITPNVTTGQFTDPHMLRKAINSNIPTYQPEVSEISGRIQLKTGSRVQEKKLRWVLTECCVLLDGIKRIEIA